MNGVCPHCHGSGWIFSEEKGRESVRRCACAQGEILHTRSETANIPPHFIGMELKGYLPEKGNPSQAKARKLCEKFVEEYPAVTKGLLLQGPTGVGKTRLLCSVGNMLLKGKHTDVHYIDWNELVREMKSGEDASARDFEAIDELIQRLSGAELLLFDEIGASRASPYVEDNIYYIVNRRYNQNRITLFASNFLDQRLGPGEILQERVGLRIRSRLYEMADSIEISGADYRQKHG